MMILLPSLDVTCWIYEFENSDESFDDLHFCQLLEAQSEYHRTALQSLENVLPKVRHHLGMYP